MNYSPKKEPTLREILIRQTETEADFAYSIAGNIVSIVDLNLGNRSVTNDVENVLRKIEHFTKLRLSALKSCTAIPMVWDGIAWAGQHASFFALAETEERRARTKLLDRK